MDEQAFRKALKKKGKKEHVIDRNVKSVKKFGKYLEEVANKELVDATTEDIEAYIQKIESEKKSAKGPLYVLMNYFSFIQNDELLRFAAKLREQRTAKSRRVFPLKKLMDINQEYVKRLATIGIENVEQMLKKGKTRKQREELAEKLQIPESAILELVKLSDLTRMGYIRTKLSRLYYNAGLDSPAKVAPFEAEELYEYLKKYIEKSGWDGMIPNLGDLKNNIKNARKLKKIVEE